MFQHEFVQKINSVGGKAYIVGGWVRDVIRKVTPKDRDYVITGVDEKTFNVLFPDTKKIGKSFPVYLVDIGVESCEVAFARSETKSGNGYKGFEVFSSPDITISNDLGRRDTTMNSIAYDLQTDELIDPYGGITDIESRLIRATSAHFLDDPVRALRAVRQSAQFGFTITGDTIELMALCKSELMLEPKERLVAELQKALKTPAPSMFFKALQYADLLSCTYPQIHALIGQTQPLKFHPEGDAFMHTMEIVDSVAQQGHPVETVFAALMHDIGKGLTPKSLLPNHTFHVKPHGSMALAEFCQSLPIPNRWFDCAAIVIKHHMRVSDLKQAGKIVSFLIELNKSPISPNGFSSIIIADKGSLPDCLVNFNAYTDAIHSVSGHDAPEHLQGVEIGQWLTQQQIRAYLDAKTPKEER